MSNVLPATVLPSEEVQISDVTVTIRSLTRSQAYALKGMEDEDAQETAVIAWGTGSTMEEAKTWRAEAGFGIVSPLVNAILELSGLTDPKG
jgi:hypothetical protein